MGVNFTMQFNFFGFEDDKIKEQTEALTAGFSKAN